MILRIIAVSLTLAALMIAIGPPQMNAGGSCTDWAAEIGDPRNSYRLRKLGCFDPVIGEMYVARPGICNQIARQGARAGLRGHDVVVYVRGKNPACYWNPDYRNYAVALTTQGG